MTMKSQKENLKIQPIILLKQIGDHPYGIFPVETYYQVLFILKKVTRTQATLWIQRFFDFPQFFKRLTPYHLMIILFL